MSAKSMWMGMLAAIVIAFGAGVILQSTGDSSEDRFSTPNVRIN